MIEEYLSQNESKTLEFKIHLTFQFFTIMSTLLR